MFLRLLVLFAIPVITYFFLKNLNLGHSDLLYMLGISILGSSVFSVEKKDAYSKSYTFTNMLYIFSVLLVFVGFFNFAWYLVLIPIFIGSYYLYLIRRITWIKLYMNGKSGLENVNWDNLFIPTGIVITFLGLISK